MIRLTFMLRRRDGLSLDDFQQYWREQHGPLVASHATHLGIRRYVQVHALADPLDEAIQEARGGMEPGHDGVAELWFDSLGAIEAALATEAGAAAAAALLEDEARFIDLARSPLWLNVEYPQVNPVGETLVATPRSSYVKVYFPLRMRADVGFEAGQRYWRETHGPLIRSQAQAMGILRYQQIHRLQTEMEQALREPRGCTEDAYDGHAEVWIDRGLMRGGDEARRATDRAIEDESKFIDFGRSSLWLGKELPVVDRMGWL